MKLQFLPGSQRLWPSLGGVGGSLKAGAEPPRAQAQSLLGRTWLQCPSVHVPTQHLGRHSFPAAERERGQG